MNSIVEIIVENHSQSSVDVASICAPYETYTVARFSFVMIATVIALLGVVGNLLLVYLFATRRCQNTPPTLYPSAIALLDVVICTVYVLIFGIDAIIIFLRTEGLFILYYIYIIPAYVASRIAQLAIPYLLIFATLERFVWISGKIRSRFLKKLYTTQGRYTTLIVSLSICMALRLPTYWAMKVQDFPKCPNFLRTKLTEPSDWTLEDTQLSAFYYFFDFHILSICQSVLPFVVLVVFNLVIVKKLGDDVEKSAQKHKLCTSTLTSLAVSCSDYASTQQENGGRSPHHQSVGNTSSFAILFPPLKTNSVQVRSAIHTMVAIVTSYLISTTLHLILTVMERSGSSILVDSDDREQFSTFHTVFSDTVTFVFMFTSAIRILIYYGCNPKIRDDINVVVFRTEQINYV